MKAPQILLGLMFAGAGVLLLGAREPFWWLGVALCAGAWPLLEPRRWLELWCDAPSLQAPRRALGGRALHEVAREVVCQLTVVAVAAVLLGPCLSFDAPISQDHPMHMAKVHAFKEIPGLLGWTMHGYAGQPTGYLYPPTVELWTGLVQFLSLGALGVREAYAFGFWAFYAFLGLATYRLGRAWFGRAVGVLGAVLLLSDPGWHRLGGFVYTVNGGVWPQSLALAFALLALSHLPRTEWRHVGWFGAWAGLSLAAHPSLLVFWLAVAPPVAWVWLTQPAGEGTPPLAHRLRVLLALPVAALVASGWLLPFLSVRDWAMTAGYAWQSTWEAGAELLALTALQGTLPWMLGLGCVGLLAWALLPVSRLARALAAAAALLFLLATSSLGAALQWGDGAGFFDKLQYPRFVIFAKPLLALAAGWAVARGVAAVYRAPLVSGPLAARVTAALWAGALAGPFLVPWAVTTWRTLSEQSLAYASERPAERLALVRWLEAEMPRDGAFRLAVMAGPQDHDLLDLSIDIGAPIYRVGYSPAGNFRHRIDADSSAALQAVNARWLVSAQQQSAPHLRQLAQHGRYRVYEVAGASAQPFTVQGSGAASLEHWSHERVVVNGDANARGELRFHVSAFPRWVVRRDGAEVPWRVSALPGVAHSGFITVEFGPGRFELTFERRWPERAAPWLMCLGFAFAIGLGSLVRAPLSPTRERLERRLEWLAQHLERRPGALRGLGYAASVALLGVVVASAVRLAPLQPVSDAEPPSGAPLWDLGHALPNAQVQWGEQTCTYAFGRHLCGKETSSDVELRIGNVEELTMRRCVVVTPPLGGTVSIRLHAVPAGALHGHVGVLKRSPLRDVRGVPLEVRRGGEVLASTSTAAGFATTAVRGTLSEAGDLELVVGPSPAGEPSLCIGLQVTEPLHGGN